MKSFILSALIVFTFSFSSFAENAGTNLIKVDSTGKTSFEQLLGLYYNIKDALVNSDASAAASKAGELVNAIQKIDMKSLTETEHKAFMPLQDKLTADAKDISQIKDLAKQRIYFASLSDNFYLLAKAVKLSTEPIYYDYCPMKKKYWLSRESAIKNPYFGKAMPTCGEVKETLK